MTRSVVMLGVLGLFCHCSFLSSKEGAEPPEAVQKAGARLFGAKAALSFDKEGDLYEVGSTAAIEVVVTGSGEVRETEVEVPAATLPRPVVEASGRRVELQIDPGGDVVKRQDDDDGDGDDDD